MYHRFFGLEKMPFSMTPDPDFLYKTPKHREALAALQFAVAYRKGFLVLVGEAGTGKTTLLRDLLRSVPNAEVSSIVNPTLTASEFFELTLINFGILKTFSGKAQRLTRFHEFLNETHSKGKTAVLIVDEAHKLAPELLEEIRLLTNFETTREKLLQIILAGQPELLATLDRIDMRQLKQRISVQVTIDPLTSVEVEEYIRSRWAQAGAKSLPPFSSEAMELVAQASGGIPRVVNAICDNALLTAFGEIARLVEAAHIHEVLKDLRIPWLAQEANSRITDRPRNDVNAFSKSPAEPVIARAEPVLMKLGTNRNVVARAKDPIRWSFPFGFKRSR